MKDWTIKDIEKLTFFDMLLMDGEWVDVKGHEVFLTDFGGYFGYSALVCADMRHLHYANEYELHYRHYGMTHEELKDRYIEKLSKKLFTEEEILTPSDSYSERQAKGTYLVNTYSYRRECWHHIGPKPDWCDKGVTVCPGWFVTYHSEDIEFARRLQFLYRTFVEINDPLRDYEHAYDAFVYEMFNYEYAISWQGDWDVIRRFANVDGDYAEDMLPKTGWGEDIIRAYYDAARYVKSHTDC